VSTIENHAVHVLGFNIFITSAMLHMVAATYMFAKSRRRDQMAPSELLSYRSAPHRSPAPPAWLHIFQNVDEQIKGRHE
jgi:hypothetical protein